MTHLLSQLFFIYTILISKKAWHFKVLLICATLKVKKGRVINYVRKNHYADRPFRDEFIEEIHTIAPGYVFKTELQPEDLPNVEISLGWNSNYQEKLLASSNLKWVQSISAGVDQLPLEAFSKNISYFQMEVVSTVNRSPSTS